MKLYVLVQLIFIDAQFHKKFEWNQLPLQFLEPKNVDCHYLHTYLLHGTVLEAVVSYASLSVCQE